MKRNMIQAKLVNGKTFVVEPSKIHEKEMCVEIDFNSGTRVFASWYVTLKQVKV